MFVPQQCNRSFSALLNFFYMSCYETVFSWQLSLVVVWRYLKMLEIQLLFSSYTYYLRMYFRVCFTLSISFWSMFPRQIVNNDGTCITNLAWFLRRLSFPCSKHQLTSSSNFSSKSVSHWIAESAPTNKSKKIIIFLSF